MKEGIWLRTSVFEMSISLSSIIIEPVVVNRYLRRGLVTKVVLITKIALILVCVVLLTLCITDYIRSEMQASTLAVKLENDVARLTAEKPHDSNKKQKRTDIDQIVSKNVFGDLGPKLPDKTALVAQKATLTALSLVGTFIANDVGKSYAIIENQKKKVQEDFSVNDMVFGEAKLVSVLADRVEIERNGSIEVLKLDEGPESSSGGSAEGNLPADDFVVPEGELETALQNLPLLLTQARAVPYFKGGQSVGLRLFAIKSGSLYEKVGLKNGDILKSINESSLSDITQAVKLFEMLKQEKNISVTVERNREDRVFRYQIR